MDKYYVLHDHGIFYTDPNGYNWISDYISSKGDAVTDLTRNLSAEQEAKITYEWLINLTNDQDILATLIFLRQREVVHFQRFGEANRTRWNRTSGKRVADKIKLRVEFFVATRSFFIPCSR